MARMRPLAVLVQFSGCAARRRFLPVAEMRRTASSRLGTMECNVARDATIRSGFADCGELRAAGYEAYLAGGCVRDLLLGREPKDYDVATSATPDVVLRMFPRTFAVGAHFGVVLVAGGYGR